MIKLSLRLKIYNKKSFRYKNKKYIKKTKNKSNNKSLKKWKEKKF